MCLQCDSIRFLSLGSNKSKQNFLENVDMWCWRRVKRVNWKERKTNDSVLNEINETEKVLELENGIWWWDTLIHANEFLHSTIEERISSKRDRIRPRTSYIEKKDFRRGGLRSYNESKRREKSGGIMGNCETNFWIEYRKKEAVVQRHNDFFSFLKNISAELQTHIRVYA